MRAHLEQEIFDSSPLLRPQCIDFCVRVVEHGRTAICTLYVNAMSCCGVLVMPGIMLPSSNYMGETLPSRHLLSVAAHYSENGEHERAAAARRYARDIRGLERHICSPAEYVNALNMASADMLASIAQETLHGERAAVRVATAKRSLDALQTTTQTETTEPAIAGQRDQASGLNSGPTTRSSSKKPNVSPASSMHGSYRPT